MNTNESMQRATLESY